MTTMIRDDHTIVAQCTPQGSGAIALIRISGIQSFEIVSEIAQVWSNIPVIILNNYYGMSLVIYTYLEVVTFLLPNIEKAFKW